MARKLAPSLRIAAMKRRALSEPTREQLERALRVAGCSGTLDEALASPAIALALKNTARALDKPRRHGRIDFRMRAANDDAMKENHER